MDLNRLIRRYCDEMCGLIPFIRCEKHLLDEVGMDFLHGLQMGHWHGLVVLDLHVLSTADELEWSCDLQVTGQQVSVVSADVSYGVLGVKVDGDGSLGATSDKGQLLVIL